MGLKYGGIKRGRERTWWEAGRIDSRGNTDCDGRGLQSSDQPGLEMLPYLRCDEFDDVVLSQSEYGSEGRLKRHSSNPWGLKRLGTIGRTEITPCLFWQ